MTPCLQSRTLEFHNLLIFNQTESFRCIEWAMSGLQKKFTCFQAGTDSTVWVAEIQIGTSG